ncbi:MAG: HupE/UreJ family protein [Thermosynechococcaceae cyanobacterium]
MLTCLGAMLVWLGAITPSTAHWADLAVADITVGQTQTDMTLTLPTGLVAFADRDGNGQLSAPEIGQSQTQLQTYVGDRVQIRTAGGQLGVLTLESAPTAALPVRVQGAPGQHSTLRLHYRWPQPVADLTMSYRLFLPGVNSAQCLATIFADGQTRTVVFTPEQPEIAFISTPMVQQAIGFIGLGIQHIWTGYDHILFLLSLLMLGGGLPSLLKVVTAFTVSHSITLSLAVLGAVSLPGRLVESAIALTIVYVAAENFWRKTTKGRWLLTFAFGLIHGFGFASILREMAIPRDQLALALGSFNLGVELGQVAVVGLMFMGLQRLRPLTERKLFRNWVSASIVVMGLIWFTERTFGAS